jgi:hypothetical protein
VYETTSVDTAVANLNAAIRGAMEQAIPRGYSRKSKFPPWFSHILRHYVAMKNYFHRRFKKKPSDYFYDRFALYRKLVKSTIKSDTHRWSKSTDNNLNSQPQHFWKYISDFRKHRSGSIQLNVDNTHLAEPLQLLMLSLSVFNQFIITVDQSIFPVSHSVLNVYPLLLFLMRMSATPSRD